jgi:hypothetical protein
MFVKTLTGKTPSPWPNGCIFDQFPTRGTRLRLDTTSLRLARQVSNTTGLRLARQVSATTGTRAQKHSISVATDACGEANLHVTRERQLAAMHAACPGKSLNVGLTSRAAITSLSTSTLPHAKLSPRHPITLYDAHKLRPRLGRGKLGRYSGRLRQGKTTRGEGQASRNEQSGSATRRLPRQGIATGFNAA